MSLDYARAVLRAEIAAIQSVLDRLGPAFEQALHIMQQVPGQRVVTCGIGKAGFIARKVAATLASTGTDAIFLHPADALHGDLGMVRKGDVALLFSNSGESDEISRLLPFLRRQGLTLIAVTSSVRSTLGVQADVVLEMGDLREACPLGLAPTASTTAMLALGDALAMALMRKRGFSASEYGRLHPAGELGRKAFLVRELMRGPDAVALVPPEASVREAIQAVSRARAGAGIVVDRSGKLLGIFTDGDLRRAILADDLVLTRPIMNVMVHDPCTVRNDAPASEALGIMRTHRIGELPVLDENDRVVGMVDLKGVLAARLG